MSEENNGKLREYQKNYCNRKNFKLEIFSDDSDYSDGCDVN